MVLGALSLSAFGTISMPATCGIAMAILYCRDFLWPFALFFLSAAMRHAITIWGARLLTAMCLVVGVLWNIPASANYVDRVVAGFLMFLLDALQGCVGCAAAIVKLAATISNMILALMRKMTCKRIYQVLALLGVVLLYTYITLAAIFVVCASRIAYQNLLSVSASMVFVIGLWIWIPAIYAYCRHLLPGYMTGIVPITAVVLVIAD